MGMQRHTPTPWEVRTNYRAAHRGDIWSACKGFPSRPVASTVGQENADERAANAAFIVKAVNAHEQLVKALQQIALFDDTSGEVARAALKAADADGG
jgi:hypothetical protein